MLGVQAFPPPGRRGAMNYRHAFHAGNFADLLKHALLSELLAALTADAAALTVIDTHAGAGVYDLGGAMARKTGEAERGVAVLMTDGDAPAAFNRLKHAVRRANGGGPVRLYPGSPMLIAHALRPRDAYIACEVRPDDYATLKQALPRDSGALALKADGWTVATQRTRPPPARMFVLIDPPFERGDDYGRIVETVAAVLRINPAAVIAIWLPIKELATYDAFLGDLEDALTATRPMVAEVRLRALSDPTKMNGCAVAVINPPANVKVAALEVSNWIARVLGEADARASVAA
jgi:23S rRNA (adenine2030-N6)-methyltransferase